MADPSRSSLATRRRAPCRRIATRPEEPACALMRPRSACWQARRGRLLPRHRRASPGAEGRGSRCRYEPNGHMPPACVCCSANSKCARAAGRAPSRTSAGAKLRCCFSRVFDAVYNHSSVVRKPGYKPLVAQSPPPI